jgi:lipopolysaccharide export system ATP-binding protein
MRDRNIGILITDHNVRETLSVTDRAYIIHEGTVLFHGPAEELVANQEVRRLYLGENFYMDHKAHVRRRRQPAEASPERP